MYRLLFSLVFSFLFISSCQKNVEKNYNEEAVNLFNQSAQTIIDYHEMIDSAKDSLEVDSIYADFEKKITDINFECPPQTDFKLSEQENDSLFFLISRLNELKKSKLKDFQLFKSDTLFFDSIKKISAEKGF